MSATTVQEADCIYCEGLATDTLCSAKEPGGRYPLDCTRAAHAGSEHVACCDGASEVPVHAAVRWG